VAEAALTGIPDDLRFSPTNAPGKESYSPPPKESMQAVGEW